MTAILSILAVLGSAIWYYRAAELRGQLAVGWAISGAMLYYGGFLIWMHLILEIMLGAHFQAHGFWVGISMDMSAIGFGLLVVSLSKKFVLERRATGLDTRK